MSGVRWVSVRRLAASLLVGVAIPGPPLTAQASPSTWTPHGAPSSPAFEGERQTAPGPGTWFASLQYVGLTWHFGGGTFPERYPWRLDPDATFVVHAGLAANLDRRLSDRWFARASVVGYADCALQPAAVLHLGIRGTFLRFGAHQLNAGLGPTYITRRSWHGRVEGYRGDKRFRGGRNGGWESFWILYGSELEYLSGKTGGRQFQASFVPWPEGITLKAGVRWAL